eukprot:3156244-Amphidinium_carterae.1
MEVKVAMSGAPWLVLPTAENPLAQQLQVSGYFLTAVTYMCPFLRYCAMFYHEMTYIFRCTCPSQQCPTFCHEAVFMSSMTRVVRGSRIT